MLHLARFAIGRPRIALAVWAVVAAVLIAIGLGVDHKTSPSITVVPGTGSSRAQTLAREHFGPSILVPILLQGPKAQLDAQGPKLVRDLSARSDARVMSAWSTGEAGTSLRPRPTAAMIVVSVARTETYMVKKGQTRIEALVRRDVAAPLRASVSGQPTLDRALRSEAVHSTRRAMALAIPILFLLLLLMLRSPLAAAVIAAFGATTAFAGFGAMALLARSIEVDAAALALSSMTGLALGVGYSLMLVHRFRQEESGARDRADAVHAASVSVMSSGRAILFAGTALIVALLLATALSSMKILTSQGIGVLLCSALSVGAAVAVLPAVLVLMGHRLDVWHPLHAGLIGRMWERLIGLGDRIVRRPVFIGAIATAALAALALPVLSLKTGPPDITQLPASSSARQNFEEIGRVMGPGWATPYNVLIVSDRSPITTAKLLPALARLQRQFARDPRVDSVLGPGAFVSTQKDLSKFPTSLNKSAAVAKSSKTDLKKLENGLGQAGAGAVQLRSGLSSAASGAGKLNAGSGSAQGGAGKLKGGLTQARTGAAKISAGLKTALAGAIALRDGAAQALAGSKKLKGGLGTAAGPINTGLPAARQMAADAGKANDAIKAGSTQAKDTSAAVGTALGALQGVPESSKSDPGYQAAVTALTNAKASADSLTATLSGATQSAAASSLIASAFATQTAQLATGVNQLLAGSTELAAGIARLEKGNADLAGGLSKLNTGGGDLTAGLSALEQGAGQLESGLGQLTTGTGQLKTGLASGVAPTGELIAGLGTMQAAVAKARSSVPSTADLERLKRESPGLFDSGYFVLAAIQGASPANQAVAGFAVNLSRGGTAAQILVIPKLAARTKDTQELGTMLRKQTTTFAKATNTAGAVGGPAGELADFNSTGRAKIALVVPVVAVAIALLLMVALRAVVLPVVAVLLDLLSVGAGFGILLLLFRGSDPVLGGPGYLDPMSIIGIFAVVFGLTATYEVLLLVRTRERFVATGDARESLRHALRSTAAASTGAGVVMAAAVVPFATTDLIPVRQFGIGIAVVVLIDALIVRPLLLPAAVAVLGPRVWWPTHGPAEPGTPAPDAPAGASRVTPRAAASAP